MFLNYAVGREDKLDMHFLSGQVTIDLLQGSAETTDVKSMYLVRRSYLSDCFDP